MKALRKRIIAKMQAILDLVRIDDDDVIQAVERIAKAEAITASQAKRVLASVGKAHRRLRESLPESVRDVVKIDGLDAARELIAKQIGKTTPIRKALAAESAFHIIYVHSDYPPSLTKDGAYIRLANLLYFIATGEKSDLKSYCMRYKDQLPPKGHSARPPGVDLRRGPRRS